ncbi:hypothetical protein SAMN05421786_10931 [Chryseobacterium ureilyticum]|uniref:Uncharacterized protein n=1 Tax=Chryseobacterium ureilyticum TaxID=373668 RepID=A0A1N7QDL7_9FLAO|nr:hypothetical protein [Chryseobacterium ureilyticum]SIT20963.1 hypothetical protein SAMN05421786_10931 [Chryseobacterium ureilyticum]
MQSLKDFINEQIFIKVQENGENSKDIKDKIDVNNTNENNENILKGQPNDEKTD